MLIIDFMIDEKGLDDDVIVYYPNLEGIVCIYLFVLHMVLQQICL